MGSQLSIARGTALYVGALLGPGLLLLPGLAVRIAGPASFLAWVALLGVSGLIAAVFGQLGIQIPSAGGVQAYATAGLGERAGRAVGWCFLAGVIIGAPIVCLIGGNYLAVLLGGGRPVALTGAALLLVGILTLSTRGLHASTLVQMALVGLLLVLVGAAVLGPLGHARAASWRPFTPHGWPAVGTAGATLMFSFVGWEAVSGLTGRFPRPRTQVPTVIAIAFAATSVIYLALAAVTVGVLGDRAATAVPLARLLEVAFGPAGRALAALAAVVLTLGTTNAYLNGAAELARSARGTTGDRFPGWLGAVLVAAGAVMFVGVGTGVLAVQSVVTGSTACFLVVYLGCTAAAVRLLRGRIRVLAGVAFAAVVVVAVFCGWALLVPVGVVLVAVGTAVRSAGRRAPTAAPTGPHRPRARLGRPHADHAGAHARRRPDGPADARPARPPAPTAPRHRRRPAPRPASAAPLAPDLQR